MVVLGIDAHKRSHTVVAVNEVGRQLAAWTVPADDGGHLQLLVKVRSAFPGARTWAVEDCRHVTGRLERALLGAGETIVRVPPKMMAVQRRVDRRRGKSDPIDALAVARAALAHPDLPVAVLDEHSQEVKRLVDHRESLVRRRTAVINQLRWHLHALDPALEAGAGDLTTPTHLNRLADKLARIPTSVSVQLARDLLGEIRSLNRRIKPLTADIDTRAARQAPGLLAIPGCGGLTAAKILAETGGR